jgi:hypothetical protein
MSDGTASYFEENQVRILFVSNLPNIPRAKVNSTFIRSVGHDVSNRSEKLLGFNLIEHVQEVLSNVVFQQVELSGVL